MNKKDLLMPILFIGLSACSQFDMQTDEIEMEFSEKPAVSHELNETKISEDIAKKVAAATRLGTRSESGIKDVVSIDSEDGVTLVSQQKMVSKIIPVIGKRLLI